MVVWLRKRAASTVARKVKSLYPAKPILDVATMVVRIQGVVRLGGHAASTCTKGQVAFPSEADLGCGHNGCQDSECCVVGENAASTCQTVKLLCPAKGDHIGVVEAKS